MKTGRLRRRLAALLCALSLLGISAVGNVAVADDSSGNIDPDRLPSLTIVKVAPPSGDSGGPADGTENHPTTGTPLYDVQFTINRVVMVGDTYMDLTTQEAWDVIENLTAAELLERVAMEDEGGITLGPNNAGYTDSNGKVVFPDLRVALYLVRQTGSGDYPLVGPSAPFLVTLPMPGQTSGEWNYDVFVYPKSSVVTAEKSAIEDGAYTLGDSITWRISARLPGLFEGQSIGQLSIEDQLPAGMEFQRLEVRLSQLSPGVVELPDELNPVDPDKLEITIDEGTGLIRVAVKPEYLAELDQNPTDSTQVAVRITARVVEIPDGGQFVNGTEDSAFVQIGDARIPVTATSTWGQLRIKKTAQDTNYSLEGAEFAVYKSEEDAQNDQNRLKAGEDRSTEVSTAEDGTIYLRGLRVSGVGLTSAGDGCVNYFVRELQAPVGYVLPPESERVTPIEVCPGVISEGTFTQISNVQRSPGVNMPSLPGLGATGAIVLPLVGGAAILFAIGAGLKRRRSQQS